MTKFRDLNVGDTFDFISPDRMLNSFYARCVKVSARTYTPVEPELPQPPMRVGTVDATVYHVERPARPTGYLFTEAEARRLAAESRGWTARKTRNGQWMVWCEASDHYVEF